MAKLTLPPENAEDRTQNISEFCRQSGPHLKGYRVHIGGIPERVAKAMAQSYPAEADGSVPAIEQK